MMTSADKVGGWVKKGQNHDDVILEWYPSWLSIPSTINTEKELLRTAVWADTRWAGFWQTCLYIKYIFMCQSISPVFVLLGMYNFVSQLVYAPSRRYSWWWGTE